METIIVSRQAWPMLPRRGSRSSFRYDYRSEPKGAAPGSGAGQLRTSSSASVEMRCAQKRNEHSVDGQLGPCGLTRQITYRSTNHYS